MSNHHWGRIFSLVSVIATVALVGVAVFAIQSTLGRERNNLASDCIPTPAPQPLSATASPTPDFSEPATPYLKDNSAPTPIPIAETFDLAPAIPESQKSHVLVFRCDGTLVEYLIAGDADTSVVPLAPGDTIYMAFAPSSITGIQLHEPTPTIETTATPAAGQLH